MEVDCFTRERWRLSDCRMGVFQRLRRRQLIGSAGAAPYRISRLGLAAVRAQLDLRLGGFGPCQPSADRKGGADGLGWQQ